MRLPPRWFTEPVIVSAYTGEGAHGPVFAAPVTLGADVDSTRTLVRDSDGAEVISEAILRLLPTYLVGTETRQAEAILTPGTNVTVGGRNVRVIQAKPITDLAGRVVYLEVAVT